MTSDAVLAVVAVTGESTGAHRAHDGLRCELRRLDLGESDQRLKVECGECLRIVHALLVPSERGCEHPAQRTQAGERARELRGTGRQLAAVPHRVAYECLCARGR